MFEKRVRGKDKQQCCGTKPQKEKKPHATQKRNEKTKVKMHRNGDAGCSKNSFSI